MVKTYTEKEVEAMIVLRYRRLVNTANHPSFATYEQLGKLFKCSRTLVRDLILKRQAAMRGEPPATRKTPRKKFGLKFLKDDHINWTAAPATLKA